MIVMVPVSLASGLILGSAHPFVRKDIEAVRSSPSHASPR
jgi:hypothetical protein